MSEKFDIGLIASDQKLIQRVTETATTFAYTMKRFGKVDEINENTISLRLLIIAGAPFESSAEFASYLIFIKKRAPQVFKLFIITKNSLQNCKAVAQAQEIDITLNEREIYESSKSEYIFSQVVRASYLPIKPGDIAPDQPITFDIYHLLPQHEKFIKFCFKNDVIDQKRYEKLTTTDELYIPDFDSHGTVKL